MLDYLTLVKKPKIEINGESTIDLLYKTIDLDDKSLNGDFVEVNQYYIARPDLISLAVYGDDKYADVICKVNGISNPFELNEGTLLFIPTMSTINNLIDLDASTKTTKKLTLDTDINISASSKVGNQKEKNEERSPAQQLVGDTNYIIDKSLGVVFY